MHTESAPNATEKTCRLCGSLLPIADFKYHPNTSDRLNTYCKRCCVAESAAIRDAKRDPDKARERERVLAERRIQKFWQHIQFRGVMDCWEWHGIKRTGYGRFNMNGKLIEAHRYAYELLVGPIPDGLVVDHLCRNPGCVNPAHLEAVTEQTNILRGIGPTAKNAQKTHCLRGHYLNDGGSYIRYGRRYCRGCDTLKQRARRLKKRAARLTA